MHNIVVKWTVGNQVFEVEAKTVQLGLRKLLIHLWGPTCSYSLLSENPHDYRECMAFPILDLHHCFIKKNDWVKNPNPEYIHHPYNTVMICRVHHSLYGDTEEFRKQLWKLQTKRYGYIDLIRYLEEAPAETIDRFWRTTGYWTPMLN